MSILGLHYSGELVTTVIVTTEFDYIRWINFQVQWQIPFSPTRDFSESRWDSNPAPKREEDQMDVDEEVDEELQSKTPVLSRKKFNTPFRIPFKQD